MMGTGDEFDDEDDAIFDQVIDEGFLKQLDQQESLYMSQLQHQNHNQNTVPSISANASMTHSLNHVQMPPHVSNRQQAQYNNPIPSIPHQPRNEVSNRLNFPKDDHASKPIYGHSLGRHLVKNSVTSLPPAKEIYDTIIDDDTLPTDRKLQILEKDNEHLRKNIQEVKKDNESLRNEFLTKNGEVAILRKNIVKMEEDLKVLRESLAHQNAAADLREESIRLQLQKEIERLNTELQFKNQEIQEVEQTLRASSSKQKLSQNPPRKLMKTEPGGFPSISSFSNSISRPVKVEKKSVHVMTEPSTLLPSVLPRSERKTIINSSQPRSQDMMLRKLLHNFLQQSDLFQSSRTASDDSAARQTSDKVTPAITTLKAVMHAVLLDVSVKLSVLLPSFDTLLAVCVNVNPPLTVSVLELLQTLCMDNDCRKIIASEKYGFTTSFSKFIKESLESLGSQDCDAKPVSRDLESIFGILKAICGESDHGLRIENLFPLQKVHEFLDCRLSPTAVVQYIDLLILFLRDRDTFIMLFCGDNPRIGLFDKITKFLVEVCTAKIENQHRLKRALIKLLSYVVNRYTSHLPDAINYYQAVPRMVSYIHLELDAIQCSFDPPVGTFYALQLVDILFARSHKFRLYLLAELPIFLQLTAGISGHTLPEPREYAKKCRSLSLQLMKEWFDRFGHAYKQLEIGYNYVTKKLGISLARDDIHFQTSQSTREAEARLAARRLALYQNAMTELEDQKDRILEDVQKLSTDDVIGTLAETATYKDMAQTYGLGSGSYRIEVVVPKEVAEGGAIPEESEDNQIVFESLRETLKVLNNCHLPATQKWLQAITKTEGTDKRVHEQDLKRAIDLKRMLTDAKIKAEEVLRKSKQSQNTATQDDDDEFDDEEFVEVDSSEFAKRKRAVSNTTMATRVSSRAGQKPVFANAASAPVKQPTRIHSSVKPKLTTDGKPIVLPAQTSLEVLAAVAPEVDYDDDLYYWDKKEVQFNTSGLEFNHRWMGSGIGDNVMPESLLDSLRMRSVYYEPKVEEIPQCRAPLRNGKLCSRQDLYKCPLHGKIIARDAMGNALNPAEEKPRDEKAERPMWEQIADDVRANVEEGSRSSREKRKSVLDLELARCSKEKDTVRTRMLKKFKSSTKRQERELKKDYELRMRDQSIFTNRT
ncbi:hypothetical protein HDV05_008420 [Chytridiales sp. JEL 0842]|nr:hypothetical protein HDV05_008420 [Chytridiales sp. JEL 0842]